MVMSRIAQQSSERNNRGQDSEVKEDERCQALNADAVSEIRDIERELPLDIAH